MKFLIAILFTLCLANSVLVSEYQQCMNQNTATECPVLDEVCKANLKEWNKYYNQNCANAINEYRKIEGQGTAVFPSQSFANCQQQSVKDMKNTEINEFVQNYVMDPTINCTRFGNPWYEGKQSNGKKINAVFQCFDTQCKPLLSQCKAQCKAVKAQYDDIADEGCRYAQEILDQRTSGQVAPFSNVEEVYPFALKSCYASANVRHDAQFEPYKQCREKCVIPNPNYHAYEGNDDPTPSDGSSEIVKLSVLLFLGLFVFAI